MVYTEFQGAIKKGTTQETTGGDEGEHNHGLKTD